MQSALERGLDAVLSGGAVRHIPEEIRKMMGPGTPGSTPTYIDVDEGVWAWAIAEMVAVSQGYAPETAIPPPFDQVPARIPWPRVLIPKAIQALDIIINPKTSEVAGLLDDVQGVLLPAFQKRVANLRASLDGFRQAGP